MSLSPKLKSQANNGNGSNLGVRTTPTPTPTQYSPIPLTRSSSSRLSTRSSSSRSPLPPNMIQGKRGSSRSPIAPISSIQRSRSSGIGRSGSSGGGRSGSSRDLRRHSPPPSMSNRTLSRSPIRDVMSLADNTDDENTTDDDESDHGDGDGDGNDIAGVGSVQSFRSLNQTLTPPKLPTVAPPELASTCSSSGSGGNDHAEEIEGEAAKGAVTVNATQHAPALTQFNINKNEASRMGNFHQQEQEEQQPTTIEQSNSGIGRWRRKDMQVQTAEKSKFSVTEGVLNDGSGNNHSSTNMPNANGPQHVNQAISNPITNPTNNLSSSNNNSHSYNSSNAIPITPLHQIPYVHGGYAAAAPLFVTNSKFASILKKLLPGAYEELSVLLRRERRDWSRSNKGANGRNGGSGSGGSGVNTKNGSSYSGNDLQNNISGRTKLERMSSCSPAYSDVIVEEGPNSNNNSGSGGGANNNGNVALGEVVLPDPVKVMKWAENNPVVSAFGIWNSDSGRRTIKFLQGIQLQHQSSSQQSFDDFNNNNNDNDRQSIISGYTESVVTIGSNNFGGGFGNPRFGYRNLGNANNHSQRPKRRKQPLPEDIPHNDSNPEVNYGGVEISATGMPTNISAIPPRPSYTKPALEWDVFLDPNLVRQVDAAMTVVDNLELKLRKVRIKRERRQQLKQLKKKTNAKQIMRETQKHTDGHFGRSRSNSTNQHAANIPRPDQIREGNRSRSASSNHTTNMDHSDDENDDDHDDEDDDFDILQSHTAAQVEVDRLVSQLMRRTIIAHGSMSQLVLEAMGVAPKYNFGTVVKSSREGVASMGRTIGGGRTVGTGNSGRNANPSSPSRSMKRVSLRAGNTEFSLDIAQTYSWDEEEEQRDFEALLDPTVLASKDGKGSERRRRPTAKSSAGSKGMFMETWIHVFARTLSLLVKSNSGSGAANAGITKKSSSSSSRSKEDTVGRLLVTDRPAHIGQRGLSGLLEKMFLRRDSSFPGTGKQLEATSEDEDVDECRQDTAAGSKQLLDYDDDNSELLTNNDMFSPTTPTSSTFGGMCGMSLCLGYENNDLSGGGSSSTFPLNPHASHKMAQDIERISTIMNEPLRLVLDLKSRRVPPRVWSRLIDSLRTRGLVVEGIGSFDMDELRVIGKGCSYPLTPILFFHSVGDLQRACHANEVKNGDTVYFNGGSLMWKRSSIMEAAERGCCSAIEIDGDDYAATVTNGGAGRIGAKGGAFRSPKASSSGIAGGIVSGNYSFQPYAYPRSALSDWERVKCKSTIEDYRRHFNLKIGVYVQEFSISAEALDALSIFVNKHGDVYDQGLAFGGLNGTAVKNIRGDGYWNQRYMGRSWDFDARPSKEMTPLKPEDHHLVQKAIQAGAWGQVGTIYEVMDEMEGALTVIKPPREPCNMVDTF